MTVARRLQIHSSSRSERGPRPRNEDRALALVLDTERRIGLFAVADGLGGHGGGELAASTAISELEQVGPSLLALGSAAPDALVKAAYARTCATVASLQANAARPDLSRMGTTLSTLILLPDRAFIYHLGDSRVYLFRDGDLRQLTEDHTVAFRLLKEGTLTAEQYAVSPMRRRLYRYIGGESAPIGRAMVNLQEGDVFMLMTDGALGSIDDEDVRLAAGQGYDPDRLLDVVFSNDRKTGLSDNATAVVVSVS